MSGPPPLPSGWFPDPHGRFDHRWFNGTAWTADVSENGQRLVDPEGAAPSSRHAAGAGPAPSGNGIATASITCGLVALLFAWMPLFVAIGVVLAVLAIVFGIKGMRRADHAGRGKGLAVAGLVAGIAALLLSVVGIVWSVQVMDAVIDFVDPGDVEAVVTDCTIVDGQLVIEGTLTNNSSRTRDYTVYGVVAEPNGVSDLVTELSDVGPGATTDVRLSRPLSTTSSECEARMVVQGPLPYGIDMDRVND